MTKHHFLFPLYFWAVSTAFIVVVIPVYLVYAQSTSTVFTDGTNVGIGTSGPTQKLQVAGTVAATAFTGDGSALTNVVAGGWIDGGTNVYTATTADKVGIGTTTPNAATLEIVKNAAQPPLKISAGPTGAGDLLTVTSTGNVGIGTSAPVGGLVIMNGNLGIGTVEPLSLLHISDNGGTGTSRPGIRVESNGELDFTMSSADASSGLNAEFSTLRSRGTLASPAIVQNNDPLFGYWGYGYDGSTYQQGAGIRFVIDGTPGGSDMPGRIEFYAQSDGQALDLETTDPDMVIKNTGWVGIGTTTPNSGLIVMNGNMGIGTIIPNNKLSVMGAMGVGTTLPYRRITAPVSGMTIEGNVGVGTWNPTEKLHVVGNLLVQGSTSCTLGNGAGATNCSSDIRLKENIKEIQDALNKIQSIRGVEFDWNQKAIKPGRHDIGVIAQDVEKVFPTTVIEDRNGYKMLDYAVLVAPLIEAVKQLRSQVDEFQNDVLSARQKTIEELKEENQRLSGQLQAIKTFACRSHTQEPFCQSAETGRP